MKKYVGVTYAIVFVWLSMPSTAVAQEPHRAYVFAGVEAAHRESGMYLGTESDRSSLVPSGVFGGGVWIRRTLAIEGSVSLQRAQPLTWRFNYLFAENTIERTDDRDMPIVAWLRHAPRAGQRVGADFLVGIGIARHHAHSFTIADCGPGSNPHPCVPLAQPVLDDTWDTWERLFSVGFEVPVHVGRAATLAPIAHAMFIHRGTYLTGYNHRGPTPGSGLVASLGITASWRDR